jgi:hypothetical protein
MRAKRQPPAAAVTLAFCPTGRALEVVTAR